MPIPEFIRVLRAKIGTDPLWLVGVTAVIERDGRVLLQKPVGSPWWTPIAGIVEPGEHPAVAAAREALEETGVVVEVEHLAAVTVSEEIAYPNGDHAQYTELTFRCRWVSGEPYVADDESEAVGWFPLDDLPPLRPSGARRLRHGLASRGEAILDLEPTTTPSAE